MSMSRLSSLSSTSRILTTHRLLRTRFIGLLDTRRYQGSHFVEELILCVGTLLQYAFHLPTEHLAILFGQVHRRYHDNRDGTPRIVLAQFRDELEAVHFRHHQGEQNQAGTLRVYVLQRDTPGLCLCGL